MSLLSGKVFTEGIKSVTLHPCMWPKIHREIPMNLDHTHGGTPPAYYLPAPCVPCSHWALGHTLPQRKRRKVQSPFSHSLIWIGSAFLYFSCHTEWLSPGSTAPSAWLCPSKHADPKMASAGFCIFQDGVSGNAMWAPLPTLLCILASFCEP